jgi:hypothetical protein
VAGGDHGLQHYSALQQIDTKTGLLFIGTTSDEMFSTFDAETGKGKRGVKIVSEFNN